MAELNNIKILAQQIKDNSYVGCIKSAKFKLGSHLISTSHPHALDFYKMSMIWAMGDLEPENDKWFNDIISGLCNDPHFDIPIPMSWESSDDNMWFQDHIISS